ncbi:MAG: hypothetical protein R3F31_03430 [Verrucomicrobiales bacterium]
MDDTYHVGNLDHHLDHLLLNAGDHGGPDAERAILGDFGHSLSQQDAEYLQAANGWVNLDDASGIQGVGQLLRAHGVDYHRVEHGTVGQVMSELHAGHRVIVGLQDHNFGSNSALQLFFQEVADRLGFKIEPEAGERQAIAIKGVDFHDPHHPKILLYNPKSADGEVIPYSLEDFTKAWEGSDFSFLATDSNPQPALPGARTRSHRAPCFQGLWDWGPPARFSPGPATQVWPWRVVSWPKRHRILRVVDQIPVTLFRAFL